MSSRHPRYAGPISIGTTVGKWTVVGVGAASPCAKFKTGTYWRCRCECGETRTMIETNLRITPREGCSRCLPKNRFNIRRQ